MKVNNKQAWTVSDNVAAIVADVDYLDDFSLSVVGLKPRRLRSRAAKKRQEDALRDRLKNRLIPKLADAYLMGLRLGGPQNNWVVTQSFVKRNICHCVRKAGDSQRLAAALKELAAEGFLRVCSATKYDQQYNGADTVHYAAGSRLVSENDKRKAVADYNKKFKPEEPTAATVSNDCGLGYNVDCEEEYADLNNSDEFIPLF